MSARTAANAFSHPRFFTLKSAMTPLTETSGRYMEMEAQRVSWP